MGLLYFEVEADYQELIELRKQIAGLEKQMADVGAKGATALEPLERKFAELNARMESLVANAAVSGQKLQVAYNQMGKVTSGITLPKAGKVGREMAEGIDEADSAAAIFQGTLGDVNKGLSDALKTTEGLGTMVTAAFGVGAIGAFINKVQEVRTYFQDIESSMKVFLGDAEKASAFTADLKSYAYYNMFDFAQLAQASKQLIAYGNDVDKISGKGGILDKLSNVAAGTNVSLGEMVALYNKAKSTGQVMAREVDSWASKGVVLRDELKAMGQEASSGAISFYQLNQVLDKLTSDGGRFNNLMAEQLDNLSAAKGQLQDNMDAMYDEIGQKMEPLLKGAIDMASWLVENYEVVGKAILALASTYGVYRTALGITNALDRQRIANAEKILAGENAEVKTANNIVSAKKREIEERRKNVIAIQAELAAKRDLLQTEQIDLKKGYDEALANYESNEIIRKKLSDEYDSLLIQRQNITNSKSKKGLNKIDKLIKDNRQEMATAVRMQPQVKEELNKADQKLIANRTQLEGVNLALAESENKVRLTEEALNSLEGKNITLTDMLAKAKANLAAKMAPLKALMTNPYFLAAAAIAALIVVIYKLATAQSEEEKGYERAKEALESYNETIQERTDKGKDLISTIKDETKSLLEQETAYRRLIALYPQLDKYTQKQLKEMDTEQLMKDIQNRGDIERGDYLQRMIDEYKAQIAELDRKIAEPRQIMTQADYAQARQERIQNENQRDNLKGEMKAYEEEYEKYIGIMRKAKLSDMTHEDRLAVLKEDQELAKNRLDIANKLFNDLKEIDTSTTEGQSRVKGEIAETYTELFTEILPSLKEKAEKDPIMYSQQLRDTEKLMQDLYKVLNAMQTGLDKNPLSFSFSDINVEDIFNDFDDRIKKKEGKVNRIRRQFQSDLDVLLKDAANAETEEQQQAVMTRIETLYSETTNNLKTVINKINDEGTKAALGDLIDRLDGDLQERKNMFKGGGAQAFISEFINDAKKAETVTGETISQENKEFSNLSKRMVDARKDYFDLLTQYNQMYADYASGKDVDVKEMETLEKRVETAKKGYEELITQDRRYYNERKQLYEDEKRLRREQENIINDIEEYRIKQMRDGSGKSLEEIKLAYRKQEQAIIRGEEDLREQRAKEAKATAESQVGYVKGSFDELAYIKDYQLSEKEQEKFDNERAANVMDYIRKLNDLSKDYHTTAEKRTEQRYKAEQDILTIEESIAAIEEEMNKNSTDEGQRALENLRERLKLARQISENLKIDESQLQLYKEYGTARQKKMAIDQDYQRQIELARANGDSPYEVQRLEYKRDSEKAKIDLDELKSEVDWAGAIGAFGGVMADYSKKMYEKAKKLIDAPDFKKLSAEEQESILNLFDQIKDNIVEKMDFGSIASKVEAYEDALENYNKVYEEQMAILEDETVSEQAKIIAEEKLAEATTELQQAQHDASTVIGKTANSIDTITAGLEKIASGSLSGAYEGFQAISEVLGKTPSKWGQIISAILKLIDLLADKGIGPIINGLLEAIEKLFDNLVEEITSGRFLEEVAEGLFNIIATILKGTMKSLVNAFSNPVNSLLGGGFVNLDSTGKRDSVKKDIDKWFDDNLFGSKGAFEKLSEDTYKLSEAFEVARGRLFEDWDKQNAFDAETRGQKAIETYQKEIESLRKLGMQWGNTGSTLFSHSNNYRWWEELSKDAKKYFEGIGVTGVSSLMQLDVEQLKDLQAHASVWSQMDDNLKDYINQIIQADEEATKTAEDIDAKFAGITFDDFADNFLSKLMDINSTAYDVAGDISDYFYQAMVTDLFNDDYRKRLEEVYKKMREARAANDKAAYAEAKREQQEIARDFTADRNALAEDWGVADDKRQQQRTSSNFSAMSQEMGSELNGRFTAMQLSTEVIRGDVSAQTNDLLPALNSKVDDLKGIIGGDANNPISNIITGIQDTLAQSYLELVTIRDNTGDMLEMWSKDGYLRKQLDAIKTNTDSWNKR